MFDFDELWDDSAAEHISGRWTCKGLFDTQNPKQTEFNVKTNSEGHLRFTTWVQSSRLISGILTPKGRWIEARLETIVGQPAGVIRLAAGREQDLIVANFQPPGSSAPGNDVEAHRPGQEPPAAPPVQKISDGAEWIGLEEEDEGMFDYPRGWRPVLWEAKSVVSWRQQRNTSTWSRLAGRAALPLASDMSVQQFKARGVTGPLRALGHWELDCCVQGLERFVSEHCSGFVSSSSSLNQHVALPWLYHLVRHPRLVGVVATLLDTDDVLLFSSCMFLREAHRYMEHGVGWHQDGVLYERVLEPMSDWVTVFVALTRAESDNGCLQFVPLNFKTGFDTAAIPHYPMELVAGEISVHSAKVTHRGGPNNSEERRDCLALRYISGRVHDRVVVADPKAEKDWVVVCSGKAGQNFRCVPEPKEEMGQEGVDLRERITALRSTRYGTTTFQKPH